MKEMQDLLKQLSQVANAIFIEEYETGNLTTTMLADTYNTFMNDQYKKECQLLNLQNTDDLVLAIKGNDADINWVCAERIRGTSWVEPLDTRLVPIEKEQIYKRLLAEWDELFKCMLLWPADYDELHDCIFMDDAMSL